MAFPQYANKNDRLVLSALINQCLLNGWTVSVNDGEEWTLKRSSNVEDITSALMSTDGDCISLRDKDGNKVGAILTIYGNNGECIHDYSEGDKQFADMMKRVERMIERFI